MGNTWIRRRCSPRAFARRSPRETTMTASCDPWATTAVVPPLPMPSAITVEFLPPLDWSAYGPDAAQERTHEGDSEEEVVAEGVRRLLEPTASDDLEPDHPGVGHVEQVGVVPDL